MLLCLDREHRMAYVLGEVLQFTSEDAAAACGITPAAFRKRLSAPARRIQSSCAGTAACWTARTRAGVTAASAPPIARDRVDPADLLFASPRDALKRDMEAFTDAGAVFRSHPEMRAAPGLVDAVLRAVA